MATTWYLNRKAAGLCVSCNQPAASGRVSCEQHLAIGRAAGIANFRKRKLRALAQYGDRCVDCGEAIYEFLTLDHIDGGGTKHMASIPSKSLVNWVAKHGFPDGFATRCFNCNWLKWNNNKPTDLKVQIFNHYGSVCYCCGYNNLAALSLDHIHEGGKQHRREIKRAGGTAFYNWLKSNGFPPIVRTACFNCNSGRRSGEVCPHNRKQSA